MLKIFSSIQNSDFITHLLNKDGRFVVQDPLTMALTLAGLFNRKKQRILVNCPNLYTAQELYEHLISLIGENNLLFFPQDEIFRIDVNAYSKEMLSQRLFVMNEALKKEPKILIAHSASLTRYLPPVSLFKEFTLNLEQGESYKIKDIVDTLVRQGYVRVNKIDSQLQFALRGDILDIFPIQNEKPYRIEFFDDEIESIRFFSLQTQRSEEEVNRITISPANDILLNQEMKDLLAEKLTSEVLKYKNELAPEYYLNLKELIEDELALLESNGPNENYYKYLSYLDDLAHIDDYFDSELTIAFSRDQVKESFSFLNEQAYAYFSELHKIGRCLKNYRFFDDIDETLNKKGNLINTFTTYEGELDQELPIRSVPEVAPNIFQALENIKNYINNGNKVVVCLFDQYESFKQYLDEFAIEYREIAMDQEATNNLSLVKFNLSEGLDLYKEHQIFLSKKEIYGYRIKVSRFLHRYKQAKVLKSYDELVPGDYLVHEECGIGQFEEIVNLEVQGVKNDFLKIKYADSGVLYVPLEQFRLVRKYVSKEGAVPRLNKIGGNEWKRTKQRIKDRVNELADRLIKLYGERSLAIGYQAKPDDEFQLAFEKAFPYVLTEDQEKAVEEIKQDMESIHPMDRLLCGDVGFGKTEVAFRAAFKAILSGGQVALLCPTTLLCRQHYQRALERFALYGVKIAQFSRFVPQSEQNKQIQEIKEGKVHLIIGTHRLLSKDIEIPNLRLLIVDEEQRFGVEHKERIKEFSKNIDVLTLTATPIPRTLQMSLLGIRSLSQLQSAPSNRMPIQTYVSPKNDSLIKEAIERELARHGQVYYLHNRTSSIGQIMKKIQTLVKGARVDFVHGQMERNDIEQVMNSFYNGDIDVLICTSIIETGLDISNVNTILIENADRFGLSQLYQIKGRVGRSNKIAYAYLMYDDKKEMTDVAKKRLKAIKDFTELGSGFKIAQRDLTIRGAGDILGPEQAGFIDTVGIDMYIKLLNEVIKEKQGVIDESQKIKVTNIKMSGYIPKEYANDGDKLEIYQEIQSLTTLPSIGGFEEKLKDIYGKIPSQVELLLVKRRIDILSSSTFIDSMVDENGYIVITLTPEASSINRIGLDLFNNLGSLAKLVLASFINRQIRLKLKKNNDYLEQLEKILRIINDTCLGEKKQ